MARRLRQVLGQLDRGLAPAPERQSVGQFLAHWVEAVARPSVRPRTYQRYRELVAHLVAALGAPPPSAPPPVQRVLRPHLSPPTR